MIRLSKQNNQLLLIYQADRFNDARWLDDKLQKDGEVTLRRTFTFTSSDLVFQQEPSDDERVFLLGVLGDSYYIELQPHRHDHHEVLVDNSHATNRVVPPKSFIPTFEQVSVRLLKR